MGYEVTIYPLDGDSEPYQVTADEISFVDSNSHGPGREFGIVPKLRGIKLFINPRGIAAAEVEAQS